MDTCKMFPDVEPDDLCLTFGAFEPGRLPLKGAALKTAVGGEELEGSMVELGNGLLLAVQSKRCHDREHIFRPFNQRGEELETYRKCSCIFRRNGDSNSNFFTAAAGGAGTVWVRNEGDRSLRFQTPDGAIYRVCTGYTEALIPSNVQAQVAPIQILLELNNHQLDLQISAVYAKYGQAPWQQCGMDFQSGAHVDSYFCRIFCGDDCMGVVESYSNYFLGSPKLEFLDIASYGPTRWYARNQGNTALPLVWPHGQTWEVPADGQVYCLQTLTAQREEANG